MRHLKTGTFIVIKLTLTAIALALSATAASAQFLSQNPVIPGPLTNQGSVVGSTPYVVSPNGQYLGNFGSQYDANSVNNPYGVYGSPYSANGVNNPYSPNYIRRGY